MMCLFLVDTYNTTINDERPASVWIIKTVQMILNVSQDGCALSNQNEPRYLHTPVMIRNVEPI